MEAWALAIGFGTLLATVAGFGLALVMLVRSMRKSNDEAHAKTGQVIRDLDAKNEAAHAKTADQIRDLDAKNEAAHAGIVARVDRLGEQLSAVACDVAFLAGRQAERDHDGGGGS